VSRWHRGDAEVDTDRERLDLGMMHAFLTRSYWAEGRTMRQLRRALDGSLPFGLYREQRQVGFARVVSDRLTFAYLADVFVLEPERGRGLGTFLIESVLGWEELAEVRYWTLFTRDAHALYRRFGFGPLRGERLERFMFRPGGEP
jgi:GNAT superfamily N-acetyltransferase